MKKYSFIILTFCITWSLQINSSASADNHDYYCPQEKTPRPRLTSIEASQQPRTEPIPQQTSAEIPNHGVSNFTATNMPHPSPAVTRLREIQQQRHVELDAGQTAQILLRNIMGQETLDRLTFRQIEDNFSHFNSLQQRAREKARELQENTHRQNSNINQSLYSEFCKLTVKALEPLHFYHMIKMDRERILAAQRSHPLPSNNSSAAAAAPEPNETPHQ